MRTLTARIDALGRSRPGYLTWAGNELVVSLGARSHRIRLDLVGDHVVFTSVVARASQLSDLRGERRSEADILAELWARNARVDTVSFSFDRHRRVVGTISAVLATLDDEELGFYVSRLAEECDLSHPLILPPPREA